MKFIFKYILLPHKKKNRVYGIYYIYYIIYVVRILVILYLGNVILIYYF